MNISELLKFEWAGLFGAASTLCLFGYAALVAGLTYERRFPNRDPSWWSTFAWAIHGSLFYISILIAQLFFGYVPPSVFFTTWSYALRLHAIVAIGGLLLLRIAQHRQAMK